MENLLKVNNFKLIGGEYTKSSIFEDLICENDGSFSKEDYMVFDGDGLNISVFYNIFVCGKIDEIDGDYLTPGYKDVINVQKDIEITDLIINEYPYDVPDEISNEVIAKLVDVIKKNL